MKFCLGMMIVLPLTGLVMVWTNDTRAMEQCLEQHSRDVCYSILR